MPDTRWINRWGTGCAILAVLICVILVMCGYHAQRTPQVIPSQLGISQEYADKLFDDTYVHSINILVPEHNWQFMVKHAMEEQYVLCDAEIDGELIRGIAIRPKGNSSLASIAGQGSDRFSFKIEFDHYTPGNTYYGLDKLALNNLGQDVSCMKDYLSYQMMQTMQVPGPLCAYTQVLLNGQPFGLYLAVEAIEDSFAARCYGDWTGNLYRPDVYAIESLTPTAFIHAPEAEIFQLDVHTLTPGDRVDALGPIINLAYADLTDQIRISAGGYAGEKEEDYRVVFDTAVFDIRQGDQARYIEAVHQLCASDHPLDAMDVDTMCRYFAVHNFVNNYDSYTGIFAHNYYLCERDGKLSLIPWDYNLGFGAFSAECAYKCFARDSKWYQPMDLGLSMSTEKSFVNYPIDTPLMSASVEDRPMLRYLLEDGEGLAAYHAACDMLLTELFRNGAFEEKVQSAWRLIQPFVQQGMTFYQAEDCRRAVDDVLLYGELRAKSIDGQLNGTIPSTMTGQRERYDTLIDPAELDLSRTIDFGGLAFGITPEEVCAILDAVFDGYETADSERLLTDLSADPAKIAALAGRVFTASKLISGAVSSMLMPPLLLLASVLTLLLALKWIKRMGGRRTCR